MTELSFKDRLWIWASLGAWATWLLVITVSLPDYEILLYFDAYGEGLPELIMSAAGTLYGIKMFYKTTR